MKHHHVKKNKTPKNVVLAARANVRGGFTIIEVMISMTIFMVLVIVGMGAVLDAISEHKQSENISTTMDNLNFVMEDIARNIRLGSNFDCGPVVSGVAPTPTDCPNPLSASNILSFDDLNGQVLTYTISNPAALVDPNMVLKSVGTAPYQVISPPEVTIDFAKSGFTVRGSLPGDDAQPSVVIRLAGYVTYNNIKSNFAIETTVTPRALDS